MKKYWKISLGIFTLILSTGFLLSDELIVPVQGAKSTDWNQNTFWHYPWGESVVHKGIDIFATEGTPVIAASSGLVIYSGEVKRGGNSVLILGPKWRVHYYTHLKSINTGAGHFVFRSDTIGSVGTSGNAQNKPAHLHYAIVTLFPYFWRWDSSRQGWKKIFFLNPDEKLRE